jgi:hypothetical protein
MSVARLTAGLLAPKGKAFPIANVYANPLLDPLPMRREAPAAGRGRPADGSVRCRIAGELHARLRILAARQGKVPRTVLEAAVADYLAANGEHCPCIGSDDGRARIQTAGGSCCRDRA